MATTFHFIVHDKEIDKILNRVPEGAYIVEKFEFQTITPNGHKLERVYKNYFAPEGMPLKHALTVMVLKLTPKWFVNYIDKLPVRVIKLQINNLQE